MKEDAIMRSLAPTERKRGEPRPPYWVREFNEMLERAERLHSSVRNCHDEGNKEMAMVGLIGCVGEILKLLSRRVEIRH